MYFYKRDKFEQFYLRGIFTFFDCEKRNAAEYPNSLGCGIRFGSCRAFDLFIVIISIKKVAKFIAIVKCGQFKNGVCPDIKQVILAAYKVILHAAVRGFPDNVFA